MYNVADIYEYNLRVAAGKGDIKEIQKILQQKIDINGKNKKEENTALMMASYNGKKDVVAILVKNGANLNLQDIYGDTALFYATTKNEKEIVQILLEHGANPNIKTKKSYSPLGYAKSNGNHEIIEILEKAGAKE